MFGLFNVLSQNLFLLTRDKKIKKLTQKKLLIRNIQLNINNDPVSVFYRSGIFKRDASCKLEL